LQPRESGTTPGPAQAVDCIRYRGIDCLRVSAGGAAAIVARFGAQVLSWIPADGCERLFLSERAAFDGNTAIRGGVPVCFPQFSGLGSLPKHGLVRTRQWRHDASALARGAGARLTFRSDDQTRALWSHDFEVALEVQVTGRSLSIEFSARNLGASSFSFTGALHTYLAVSDIGVVQLAGLNGCEYRDAAGGNVIRVEPEAVVRFGSEFDRVYHHAPREVVLGDVATRLSITSAGFADTVVWNPGAALCAKLPDMTPDGFRHMLCVEAAAARVPVALAPGAIWTGGQTLTVPEQSGG
jgi:glucose-6-phosphate 1-epimerase